MVMRHCLLRKGYIYAQQQIPVPQSETLLQAHFSACQCPTDFLYFTMVNIFNPDVVQQDPGAHTFTAMVYPLGVPPILPLLETIDKLWHAIFGLYM